MSDYRPSYPLGFTPRPVAEWAIPMESAIKPQAIGYQIPAGVTVLHCAPGQRAGDLVTGPSYGWNNKNGAEVEETRRRARRAATRNAAVQRILRPAPPARPKNTRRDARSALQARILEWVTAHPAAVTAAELRAALRVSAAEIRSPLRRLVHHALLQIRCYSQLGRGGFRAQYLLAGRAWPPLPEGARIMRSSAAESQHV